MNNVVKVRGVYKKFGQETVLENVNLDLSEGAIHGIVGRNGSGKTVLMKCILGFLQPTRGEITVFGKQIGRDCDFAPHTGMMIETPGFMDTESGLANLRYLRRLTAQNDTAISPQEAMKVVGLDPGNKKHVGKYSLGMRQRLGLAQAIMEGPRLLILDEPMNGLDNQGVEDMRRLLLDFRNRGVTILLASHNPLDVSLLCDQVFTIDGGILRRQ